MNSKFIPYLIILASVALLVAGGAVSILAFRPGAPELRITCEQVTVDGRVRLLCE